MTALKHNANGIVYNTNICFILYNIVYCHCIIFNILCIVIVHHCVLSLYIIVYCIILCIVIVYHCVLLLYYIVYCHCISLCIVIVYHCVLSLYSIVYCRCIVLCIVIVMIQHEYNIVFALVLRCTSILVESLSFTTWFSRRMLIFSGVHCRPLPSYN